MLSLVQFAEMKKESTKKMLFGDSQPAKQRSPEKQPQPVKKSIFEEPVWIDSNKTSDSKSLLSKKIMATTHSPTPKTEESEMSKQSSASSDFFFQKHVIHRPVDKLNDLNRSISKRPSQFLVRPAETKIEEPAFFLDFPASSQPKKSIIKKHSLIKSSHEIEQQRGNRAEGRPKVVKKV